MTEGQPELRCKCGAKMQFDIGPLASERMQFVPVALRCPHAENYTDRDHYWFMAVGDNMEDACAKSYAAFLMQWEMDNA